MSIQTVALTPVDAWFFRDGRPYNQGESGQTDARSHFPPFAPTVVGLVRSSLALGQGWNGRERWNHSLNEVLGDGFENLGQLQFSGPFLRKSIRCDNRHKQLHLLPVPLHLLGTVTDDETSETKWSPAAFLRPADKPTVCDLGDVRLPIPTCRPSEGKQFKEPNRFWITVEGYNAILQGRYPDRETIFRSAELWCAELRVGLARHHETRTAEEGKLYSPQYVRLGEGVSLVMGMKGAPEGWQIPTLVTFGGEGRMAYCDAGNAPLPLPNAPNDAIRRSCQFTVMLSTPLYMPDDPAGCCKHPLPGEEFPGLSGSRIVSACVGKPIQIGGWNSLERKPLPLRAYSPAGSTWFCEANAATIDEILSMHGKYVGARTQYGLGQIVLGTWPDKNGETK